MAEKKEAAKEKDFVIVNELPTVPVKTIPTESGEEIEVITVAEALKEILVAVRKIENKV